MQLLDSIKQKAKQENKTIVLPEGTEERTLKAANIILEEGIASLILLGNREEILKLAGQHGLKAIEKATIIDPKTWERRAYFAEMLFEIRKNKGLTLEEADKLVSDPLYLATLLIK
ncbi:MAG: phosphate acetyltransferase, partial [Bacteroidales bacterium]|nr:phosphate acetyltransferase [Bacteroidales bacterium]